MKSSLAIDTSRPYKLTRQSGCSRAQLRSVANHVLIRLEKNSCQFWKAGYIFLYSPKILH